MSPKNIIPVVVTMITRRITAIFFWQELQIPVGGLSFPAGCSPLHIWQVCFCIVLCFMLNGFSVRDINLLNPGSSPILRMVLIPP